MKKFMKLCVGVFYMVGVMSVLPWPARSETGPDEKALAITWKNADLEWGACPPIFKDPGCEIAVLHGNPAKPNTDVFFKVPGKYHIPWHRHTSAERMVLVNGKLKVTYEGQDTAVLKRGTYAFGPAEKPHKAYCASGPCVLFIAFNEPVDAFAVPVPD